MKLTTNPSPQSKDWQYQQAILQDVSRTFALTIPQLPTPLDGVVSNAYLLCRIADTIEDDKHLPHTEKRSFAEQFIEVVAGTTAVDPFASTLAPKLSESATEAERDLIANSASVIRITHSFNDRQRMALERCIRIMADGMARYQEIDVSAGLRDLPDMDRYCYFVAGVVGEMLTELFCDYSAEIDRHHGELMRLAVSFGQGLQMTNILKDIWEDQRRGMCWLPGDVFNRHNTDLSRLSENQSGDGFRKALAELIGVAHSHLRNALCYTLLIPRHEAGIRRFCLWALGMAVLTLRRINGNRGFRSGNEVKISRRAVRSAILVTSLLTRLDKPLLWLFALTASSLPKQELSEWFDPASGIY